MDCPSCAKSIEVAVKKIEGVSDANINYASEKMFVESENEIDDKKIIESVKNIGYEAIPNESVMEMSHNMEHSQTMEHGHHSEHDHAKMESGLEIRILKNKLIFGIIASVITLILSFGGGYVVAIPKNISLIVLLILATPVEFWVGRQFWRGAYYELKSFSPGMDSLVAIGTGAAYFFSLILVIANLVPAFEGSPIIKFYPYFDAAVLVTTFIILGKFLEAKAKGSASDAIKKLLKLQAKTAHLVDVNGQIKDTDINFIKIGDVLLVKQGEKIPVDGIIIDGEVSVDESMVTGESLPVDKKINDKVIGSTINKSGLFKMKAEKIGKDTFLAQIIKIVEEAQASKAPIQKLADKITRIFVPIVIIIAIATFLIWMLFGPQPWFVYSSVNMVAVLVVACPCALGLATPVSVITGTGKGAENGIIIRNAQSLERAGNIDTIVLDKTGTITKGEPSVTNIVLFSDITEDKLLSIAASLSVNTTHPLDKAVVFKAKSQEIPLSQIDDFKQIIGKGIKGKINGTEYLFGNKQFIKENDIVLDEKIDNKTEAFENLGETTLLLSDTKKVIGIISLADTLKKSAEDTVEKLKKLGIEIWMITGDNEKTAQAIADKVGIKNILSSVLPEQKSKKIKELQKTGKVVAMVGDGINDAPALTQADVGIAIGTGTDIAIESSGITLVSGDPLGIYKSVLLSRSTLKNIRQNLFWAYAYNIILIPIAAGVLYPLYGILLNPILAGAAMAFSSLSVVLNSLRLKALRL